MEIYAHKIFEAALWEGGFLDPQQERSFQDAGQFFELILYILGKGFQLEMTRTPVWGDGTDYEPGKKTESTSQGVFYLQLPGNSLQEIVNKHREALEERFAPGEEWRVEHRETHEEIEFPGCKNTQKIVGTAPEILVVRVNNHVVDPEKDRLIDFTALFKNKPANSNYELVGFSQNHHQVHWTSVVCNGSGWVYCQRRYSKRHRSSRESFSASC